MYTKKYIYGIVNMVKKMDCLFCKINSGEIPSKTIYEDEIVRVIMDINPTSNGHILIIPKKHITDFEKMDNNTLSHINNIAKEMKKVLYQTLNPSGLVLVVNYGIAQQIKHYHLHLIPAYEIKQELEDIDVIYNKIMQNKN